MLSFKPKIGLALGGGGARGAAHLGVLRQLQKTNIYPHCISGTSAGAIVASLYAFGVELETIETEMKRLRPVSYSSFKFKGLGLFENSEIHGLLKKLLPVNAQIQDARIPLAIKATNILNGTGVVLFQGDVISAVLGSCCVPGIYTPTEIDGMLLVDGGLTENVPLSAIKHLGANIRIGVNLNGNAGYIRPEGIFDVVSNAIDIAIDAQTRKQLEEAHITISMDLTKYSRTSSEDFDELILEGMNATKKVIKSQALLRFWVILKKIKHFLKATIPLRVPQLK